MYSEFKRNTWGWPELIESLGIAKMIEIADSDKRFTQRDIEFQVINFLQSCLHVRGLTLYQFIVNHIEELERFSKESVARGEDPLPGLGTEEMVKPVEVPAQKMSPIISVIKWAKWFKMRRSTHDR